MAPTHEQRPFRLDRRVLRRRRASPAAQHGSDARQGCGPGVLRDPKYDRPTPDSDPPCRDRGGQWTAGGRDWAVALGLPHRRQTAAGHPSRGLGQVHRALGTAKRTLAHGGRRLEQRLAIAHGSSRACAGTGATVSRSSRQGRSAAPDPALMRRIPLWVKLLYTAFLAVLVPFYWRSYGPVNFLWFCDIALRVTLPALWLESPFLSSLEAVAIAFPQLCWAVDFTAHLAGIHLLGLADYMFEPRIPLFVRGLSLFHGWLPFLLLWMVWRLGDDRRAVATQTGGCIALLPLCFFFTPRPPHPAANPHA